MCWTGEARATAAWRPSGCWRLARGCRSPSRLVQVRRVRVVAQREGALVVPVALEIRQGALDRRFVQRAHERGARIEQVESVLREIGADEVPRLQVYNKIDLREGETAHVETDADGVPQRVFVSARNGEGLDALRNAIAMRLHPDLADEVLVLPPMAARLRAQLFALHAVKSESIDDDGNSHLVVRLPAARLDRLCREAGIAPPVRASVPAVH